MSSFKFRKPSENCPRLAIAYSAARKAAYDNGFLLRETDYNQTLSGPIHTGRRCPHGQQTHACAIDECACDFD